MVELLPPKPASIVAPDRYRGHASGDHSAGDHSDMDRWEMVVPKMSRPPTRSATRFISQGPCKQTISTIPPRPRGNAANSQTVAEIHTANGRVSATGSQPDPPRATEVLFSTEIGIDFVAQARRMGHGAWRTLRGIPLPAMLRGSVVADQIGSKGRKKH